VLAPVSDTQSLGKGAVVSRRALTVFESALWNPSAFQIPPPGDAFVRFKPGTAQAAAIAALERRLGGVNKVLVTSVTQPADVVNFGQVRDLPQILAALLSVLAVITMVHLLVTAIQRRRRELAVLRTLGCVPRQISAAIAWQATAVAGIALALGIPLGLASGRALWSAVAGNLGVVVQPTIPWLWVALLVPAALILANLVAAVPAASAARIAPATILRAE
jgi:ABC-type antimicrobial peptide transport system permease subunit